jgi:uncharacterized C2H2 Zn-finger protein
MIADKERRKRAFALGLQIKLVSYRHRVAHLMRPDGTALCGKDLCLRVYAGMDVPLCLKCKAVLDGLKSELDCPHCGKGILEQREYVEVATEDKDEERSMVWYCPRCEWIFDEVERGARDTYH